MVINKYEEIDKQLSKEIMKEFKDKFVPSICPYCKNEEIKVKSCNECTGTGQINYEYGH